MNTDYAELHCITNYSFLRGASHPEELVAQAARMGYRAIAITDECSLSGVVKAHVAARDNDIRLIVGSEFFLDEDIHLVLLAPDRQAYGQISHLITCARRRSAKGQYQVSLRDLEPGLEHCLALWIPAEKPDSNRQYGEALQQIFGNRLWIMLEIFQDGRELDKYRSCFLLSRSLAIPLVAGGDVHMHVPDRKPLQDTLSAIRMGQSIRLAGRLLASNREKYLRSLGKLAKLYPPALLTETTRIASLCHFSLSELRYEYPEELVPSHTTPAKYLRQLVEAGAARRWPNGISLDIRALIEKELVLIRELEYEYYFLTVYDIVHFARSQGILCQGRGSAANSVVCFCLQITEVDPARISLLFERFISKERDEPPDIDVDFEHERREEVIQYIYKKYGRHRAALAATVITYRPRSAIRDVGKALGMDLQLVDHLAKSLSWWDKKEDILERFKEVGIDPNSHIIAQFISLVDQILGFPRHLSQHVGGFVISRGPLSHLVPIENAAMEDRTIIQWDKYDIEALGLLKIDILALGMLTAIRKSFDLINNYYRDCRRSDYRRSDYRRSDYRRSDYRDTHPNLASVPADNQDTHPDLASVPADNRDDNRDTHLDLASVPAEDPPADNRDTHLDLASVPADNRDTHLDLASVPADHQDTHLDYRDTHLDLASVPAEDPLTYKMLQQGDSIGVFQVESRAQISMLPRMKPANFYDLVIEVAIVRPGPIQGKMVHPYLKRRQGLESVTYTNDAVRSVLERTLGIPIFQEQVIKLAMVAAGFSAGEADQLRRAMAAWKRRGGLEPFERKLIDGMLERGHDLDFAQRIFEQIKGFGDYGFPESHAASFALLVYVSAWIKRHEPAAFYCALLNSQPMGFYSPSQLVQDARRHNVEVRPVDILSSDWESTLETPDCKRQSATQQPALRLGLQRIKGFNEPAALRIITARQQQVFCNIEDVARRADLSRGEMSRLTEGGAFKCLAGHRYQTHWDVLGIPPPSPLLDKVAESSPQWTANSGRRIQLHPPAETDDIRADYTSLGLTLGRHPMAILRELEPFRQCKSADQLQSLNHGRFVQVAGIVTGRQRPSSAAGVIFLTLEDETNNINVVIWQTVLERFRAAVVQGKLLKIKGVMERQDAVIHVIAGHVENCTSYLSSFLLKSRDFH